VRRKAVEAAYAKVSRLRPLIALFVAGTAPLAQNLRRLAKLTARAPPAAAACVA